jgi:hypothetical protein
MAGPAVEPAKKAKKYQNPAESSPLVDFYLERQQFMDPSKRYTIDVNVNGYPFSAEFGKKNRLPEDVVSVLRNAKSAIHPSANASKVEIARGGEGRNQSQLLESTQSLQYINDYNVVIEKEL